MTTTPNPDSRLAIPALADVDVKGHTRAAFLTRSALAAGAVAGLGGFSLFTRNALAQGGGEQQVLDVLNFALTLEYLEATYYERALDEVSGLSGEVRELAEELQQNESAHVDALTQTINDLGGTPVEAPEVDFGDAYASEKSFLDLAITFEDTGVSAYNGAAPMLIENPEVLTAAGTIVQVEARHAALVRLQGGEPPAPRAFDKASDKAAVLEAIQPFLVSS